jgi:hypothetical protein
MKPLYLDHQRLYQLARLHQRAQYGAFELVIAILLALIVIPTITVVTIRQLNLANQLNRSLSDTATQLSWDAEKFAQSSCHIAGAIGSTNLILCQYDSEFPADNFMLAVD